MNNIRQFISPALERKPRAAIFLSGGGSNAEKILEKSRQAGSDTPFIPEVMITDAPETSRARKLAAAYKLPLIEHDIREFYQRHGESRFSLATEKGRRLRSEWTDELRARLADHIVDFGILAGFRPLTNITGDFPCLNVHPGDLTYEKDGKRWLVGLHTVPIERAILEGLDHLRSSVIAAQPYRQGGNNMDSGPILGLSEPVPIDMLGYSLDELNECSRNRPEKKPKGGYDDPLQNVAAHNLDRLKFQGDWIVFPKTVFDFAAGRFAHDDQNALYFLINRQWHPIQTVVYGQSEKELIFRPRH